jgi:hypothetical protein
MIEWGIRGDAGDFEEGYWEDGSGGGTLVHIF